MPRSPRRATAPSRRATSAAGPGWSATSSRAASGRRRGSWPPRRGGWTVGVLVQANYGERDQLRSTASRSGRRSRSPTCRRRTTDGARDEARATRIGEARPAPSPGAGSIIVIVATDAPLLPHQCERVAQRATLGLARMGSTANHSSGDLFLAFATGNRGLATTDEPGAAAPVTHDVRMVLDNRMTPLFKATVEATEAAVVNALLAAETLTGRDGVTAHALDHERLSTSWRATAGGRAPEAARLIAGRPEIRAATLDDVPAIRRILAAHDNDGPVERRRHRRAVRPPHRRQPPGARLELDGEVVAYGAVVDAGVAVHLADLFVEPGASRPGHRPAAARRRCSSGATRRATFASDDPRALPLYARAGMTPLWVEPLPRRRVERDRRPAGARRRPARTRAARGARAGLDGRRSAGRPRVLGDAGRGRRVPGHR